MSGRGRPSVQESQSGSDILGGAAKFYLFPSTRNRWNAENKAYRRPQIAESSFPKAPSGSCKMLQNAKNDMLHAMLANVIEPLG